MSFIVGFLTFVLVVLCLFLVLLVLVQLPKKDAGVGMAFGGGAADALFGAGSGNALTKITKYTAVGFLVLCLILDLLQSKLQPQVNSADFTKAVEAQQQHMAATAAQQQTKAPVSPAAGNSLLSSLVSSTNNAPATTSAPVTAPPATNSAK